MTDQSYWQDKWKKQDIRFNQQKPNPYLTDYFEILNLPKKSRIFVPLCGKSIDMLWLAQQGFHVIGCEFSQIACEQFFTENNLSYVQKKTDDFSLYENEQITLYCGDFFKLTEAYIFDIAAVYDRAALIALPEADRIRYSKHLLSLLSLHAQILLITIEYQPASVQGPPFSIKPTEIQSLYLGQCDMIRQKTILNTHVSDHLKAKGIEQSNDYVFHMMVK